MKISQLHNWLGADVKSRIKTPPIPLIKVERDEELEFNIIKVNMQIIPALAASDTYKIKMATFEYG